MDSRGMLALRPHLKKPHGAEKDMKRFRAKVVEDQNEMLALLRRRSQQAEEEDARRRNDLASAISQALALPEPPARSDLPTFPNTNIAENYVYKSTSRVNAACRSLLKEYSAFEDMITDMAAENKSDVTENWAYEVKETERLLRLGHEVAMRDVGKVVGFDAGMAMTEGDEIREKEVGYELFNSLRYAERGIKRMVKGLPDDEKY